MTDEHIERTDGPTPNGGAYFLAYSISDGYEIEVLKG
jgi:hypothetical protein